VPVEQNEYLKSLPTKTREKIPGLMNRVKSFKTINVARIQFSEIS
jgi:hypothetical protein